MSFSTHFSTYIYFPTSEPLYCPPILFPPPSPHLRPGCLQNNPGTARPLHGRWQLGTKRAGSHQKLFSRAGGSLRGIRKADPHPPGHCRCVGSTWPAAIHAFFVTIRLSRGRKGVPGCLSLSFCVSLFSVAWRYCDQYARSPLNIKWLLLAQGMDATIYNVPEAGSGWRYQALVRRMPGRFCWLRELKHDGDYFDAYLQHEFTLFCFFESATRPNIYFGLFGRRTLKTPCRRGDCGTLCLSRLSTLETKRRIESACRHYSLHHCHARDQR